VGYKADPYHIKLMDDYWYMSFDLNVDL
jgi:hypothetical protein